MTEPTNVGDSAAVDKPLAIGSLCTGIGGLDLAVEAYFDADLAWYSEIDSAPCEILRRIYPDVKNHGDLTLLDWASVEQVDIITAGYPCQPFSSAGKRRGTSDVRHLWPYVAEAVRVLRPRWVVLENVAGHLTLGFGDVLRDLAEAGFDADWCLLRASDVGAPHARARIFIVARDTAGAREDARPASGGSRGGASEPSGAAPDSDGERRDGRREGEPPATGRGRQGRLGGSAGAGQDAPDAVRPGSQGPDGLRAAGRALPAERGGPSAHAASEDAGQDRRGGGEAAPAGPSGGTGRRGEPGPAQRGRAVADPSGQRHGRGQDGGEVGRLDRRDAGETRQRERPREVAGDRSAAPAADPSDIGHERSGGARGRGLGSADSGDAAPDPEGAERGGSQQQGLAPPAGSAAEPGERPGPIAWGDYEPAIRRWELVLGRPAPAPVDDAGRLSPPFVEWMMGYPEGWTADLTRRQALKALGNAVVPQQALAALTELVAA